jgi:hypothetical protein
MISLATILDELGLDPKTVLVMRHQPSEPQLRAVFPQIALELRDVYNDYQSTQAPKTESAIRQASYIASFVSGGSSRAVFVGFYEMRGFELIRRDQWLAKAGIQKLISLGMAQWEENSLEKHLWFDLHLTEHYQNLFGRLSVDWPVPDRSWYRWADKNHFPIRAIYEDNALEKPIIKWDDLLLSWDELNILSRKQKDNLSHWRGVYLITDESDRMAYVGSAYGAENLLGRWLNYAKSGHGGNKLLRHRIPSNFHFSILQILPHDMLPEDVIRIENSWKARLRTRSPYGLNEN